MPFKLILLDNSTLKFITKVAMKVDKAKFDDLMSKVNQGKPMPGEKVKIPKNAAPAPIIGRKKESE